MKVGPELLPRCPCGSKLQLDLYPVTMMVCEAHYDVIYISGCLDSNF
jgi:hypothetical protein